MYSKYYVLHHCVHLSHFQLLSLLHIQTPHCHFQWLDLKIEYQFNAEVQLQTSFSWSPSPHFQHALLKTPSLFATTPILLNCLIPCMLQGLMHSFNQFLPSEKVRSPPFHDHLFYFSFPLNVIVGCDLCCCHKDGGSLKRYSCPLMISFAFIIKCFVTSSDVNGHNNSQDFSSSSLQSKYILISIDTQVGDTFLQVDEDIMQYPSSLLL